jgi:tRNA wybutosine-synthesizing protein 3|tara:strand:- start:2681 stop:3265 length:585 start_codon:yes stop_codon:yes gene_type:complete
MEFSQYKANAMKKLEYALSEGLVDEGVISVLNSFNSHPDIFTTSSCAGRLQLIVLPDIGRKDSVELRKTWHRPVEFQEVKDAITNLEIPANSIVILQGQSPIFHISCRTMELAQKFRGRVHGQGWKYSSLLTGNDDKWVVEILSANRIDNLLFREGLIDPPDDDRLKFIIEESNKILIKAQARLEALEYIPSGL